MRKGLVPLFYSLSSLFFLCSFIVGNDGLQVECVSTEKEGYVTVKVWNPQKGKNYKADQARKDAIKALLTSGLSGENGCSTQKPLLSSPGALERFSKIEPEFFERGGKWLRFVQAASLATTMPQSIGKKNWTVYQVTVATDLLKQELEDQKVVTSLNNGF